jgi:hypothetical protein
VLHIEGSIDIAAGLPYRGTFGAARPASLDGVALPPSPMPSRLGTRPLKAWRYVGVFGPELMLCAAIVRIGRARQSFWAAWDRRHGTLYERTMLRRGAIELGAGFARVRDRGVSVDLQLDEEAGIEAVCPAGEGYAWTRKQGGVPVRGTAQLHGGARRIQARAVIDDTAAYYQRHTTWQWSAGVGRSLEGQELAWNLVSGVNDPTVSSERTVWIDGRPHEPGPSMFAPDLEGVDGLRFRPEAVRARRENLLLVRSSYRQPFGTFSGSLPGGVELAEGYGVMEEHDAWW